MDRLGDAEGALRDRFHQLLGRLVHAIALFDFHIGLQVNYLGQYRKQDVTSALKPSARLADRLKRLQPLVLETYATADPDFTQQVTKWFDAAERARGLRNDYAHGRWAVPAKYELTAEGRQDLERPVLAFVPLDFDLPPGRPDSSVYLTIEDFEKQVEDAEALFSRYWRLCEDHSGHALPAPARSG